MKKNRILIYILIFLGASIYLFFKYDVSSKKPLLLDEIDYNSLAVNVLYGYGYKLMPPGFMTNNSRIFDSQEYRELIQVAPYSFFRTPSYPFFIAFVYKLGGINPVNVRKTQVILLAFCISLMPYISSRYWPKLGFFAGLISSILFLLRDGIHPDRILAETYLLFLLVLISLLLLHWENHQTLSRAFLLGLSCAYAVLIKGTVIFLTAFLPAYLFFKSKETKYSFLHIGVFMLGALFFVVPWSTYASIKLNHFVLISTQGPIQILDGNNEYSIKSGNWSPQWRNDSQAFYTRNFTSKDSSLKKVICFWVENKEHLLAMSVKKLDKAFRGKRLIFVMGTLLYYLFHLSYRGGLLTANGFLRSVYIHSPPVFPLLILLNIFFVTIIIFGHIRFTMPLQFFFITTAVHFYLSIVLFLSFLIWTKLTKSRVFSFFRKNCLRDSISAR